MKIFYELKFFDVLVSPPIVYNIGLKQSKFASIVEEVETMKEEQKSSKEHIENLFNALMQKAFKRELIK